MSTGVVEETRSSVRPHQRSAILDALRGVAIILVVLSHSWIVWPKERRGWIGPFEFLFSSGNVAVSVFFVISGFLVIRAFVGTSERFGRAAPLVWFFRRSLRILVQTWALLVAVYVVSRVDAQDPWSDTVTKRSLISAATFTWNHYVRDNALLARSDIGALYFLCIDLQFFLVALLVFLLLYRRQNLLLGATTLALLASISWRYVVHQEQGWYFATLSTTTRMDAILWGVLAGLVIRRYWVSPESANALLGAASLVLTGTIMAGAFYGIGAYFGALGVIAGAAAALCVAADSMRDDQRSMVDVILVHDRLLRLGRSSLTIFLWHIPVFQWVAVHTKDWDPLPRTLVAFVLLAIVVAVVEKVIARPVTAAAKRWGRLGPGSGVSQPV